MDRARRPACYIGALKGYAEYFRRCWINDAIPDVKALGNFFPRFMIPKVVWLLESDHSAIYLLSCFKRGLPVPTEKQSQKALELWKATVLEPAPFLSGRGLKNFTDWITSSHFRGGCENPSIRLLSGSACAEYKRSEGGRTNYLHDNLRKIRPEIYDHPVWTYGPPPDGMLTKDRILRARMASRVYREIVTPKLSEVLPNPTWPVLVKELGFKTRVVTKSPAPNVMLAHIDRDKIMYFVEQIPECIEALNEGLLPVPLSVVDDDHYVYSCDLSRATDTVSHQVLHVMARELGLSRLIFEHVYDGKPWKRGCPMGMPPSWSILSLTNYYAAVKAAPKSAFRIKGDDLIAYWTLEQIERYKFNITSLGYIVKESSSYVNPTRGLFCETPYEVRAGWLTPLEGYFSLKFLSQNQSDEINLFSIADRFHNLLDEGVPRSVVCTLQDLFVRKQIRASWSANIDPYVPRLYGGLGLVPRLPNRRPNTRYQRIVKRLVDRPFDNRPELLWSLYPKDSFGWKTGKDLQMMRRNLIYGYDRSTPMYLCTDNFTNALVEPTTLHNVFRFPSKPPRLGNYFKAVIRLKKDLGRITKTTAVNYRRSYAEMYDLQDRISPIKDVYDIVRFSHPEREERIQYLAELKRCREAATISAMKEFIAWHGDRSGDDHPGDPTRG
jgi:hypothetical protein